MNSVLTPMLQLQFRIFLLPLSLYKRHHLSVDVHQEGEQDRPSKTCGAEGILNVIPPQILHSFRVNLLQIIRSVTLYTEEVT